MTALDGLLGGLIDYAGLFPPAGLDMRPAVQNFLAYRSGRHSAALGRFVVDVARVPEFLDAAGDQSGEVPLSVVGGAGSNWSKLPFLIERGARIECAEVMSDAPEQIAEIASGMPAGIEQFYEVPWGDETEQWMAAIAACGLRAKIRMGGVVASAFPAVDRVAAVVSALAGRKLRFKATAGLHHPLRASYRLTYAEDSPAGVMHGFLNLVCAAMLVYRGGSVAGAEAILEERDAAGWRVSAEQIVCPGFRFDVGEIGEFRRLYFTGFGSCSFEEPMRELEGLGWL